MSYLWWFGFVQLVVCGAAGFVAFVVPKILPHEFNEESLPITKGLGISAFVLALIGLVMMTARVY